MTELSNVLKTYQDNALKTLQGPASLFYNTHSQYTHKGLKREIDSPPPPSSSASAAATADEEYKHASPSPITLPAGTVIERTESTARRISSPPQQQQQSSAQPQQQREYCQSPPPPPVTFVPLMQPIQSQPILTAPDSECGELVECIIEGRPIGCFQLGGELRLCFPQILNNILPEFPLDRIHRTIEDLHITCLQSTPEQLAEFKHANILPASVHRPCGLITRTNAERLCSALLHKSVKKKEPAHQSYFSFRVYHRCFGKSEGICTPDLFSFRDRECIECVECHGMLAPNRFVLHVCKNKPKENSTCHWGFESNKWRSYIHVAMSEPNQEKCTRRLDELFALEVDFERVLYEHSRMEESNHNLKRKAALEEVTTLAGTQTKQQQQQQQQQQESGYDIPLKKTKMEELQLTHYLRDIHPATLLYQFSQLSRQQPWLMAAAATSPKHMIATFGTGPPYLASSQEPPILQNPERVVRHTENERFDRSYQPNVALAPRQTILAKEREREQRDYEKEPATVIKRETVQIKQERPPTPNAHELSPELRHNSPETTTEQQQQQQPESKAAAPISPEHQSGSNEITSSTSPVPATPASLLLPSKQESVSPPHIHNHHNHHHNNHHHLPRSQHNLINSSQGHKKTSSTTSASPPSVVVKVGSAPLNGLKKPPLIGNPEFELSTDTDDESLGEPDSSNHVGSIAQTPSEFVAILLKNNSLDDHKKILDLVQYMEKEIAQLKEAHKKEVREQQQVHEEQRKRIEALESQLGQQHKLSVIASAAAACLSSSSSSSSSSLSSNSSFDFDQRGGERRNSLIGAEKPHVIIKPPKKSILRVTPLPSDECKPTANSNNNSSSNSSSVSVSVSVNGSATTPTPATVIMPKCEDIMNNNNTKMYNNNSGAATVNGQQQQQPSAMQTDSSEVPKAAIKAEKL